MEKSMIIVGAGIAGLSAGCYARMNGFKTTILDMSGIQETGRDRRMDGILHQKI